MLDTPPAAAPQLPPGVFAQAPTPQVPPSVVAQTDPLCVLCLFTPAAASCVHAFQACMHPMHCRPLPCPFVVAA